DKGAGVLGIGANRPQRLIQLVIDACRQLAEHGKLGRLYQFLLSLAQATLGAAALVNLGRQTAIGGGQVSGAALDVALQLISRPGQGAVFALGEALAFAAQPPALPANAAG